MFFFQIRQLPTFLQQVQDSVKVDSYARGRRTVFFKRRIFNDNFPVEFPFQFQHNGLQCFPGEHQFPVRHVPAVEASISRIELRPVSERDCQHLIGLYPYIFILISIHFHLALSLRELLAHRNTISH